jgi:predicted phosphohydrolase
MMKIAFDLISDLHLESWAQSNWQGIATSPFCIVAGDVAHDYGLVQDTLQQLSEQYQAVLYIDGNEEHKRNWHSIGENFQDLEQITDAIEDVVFLQDNVVIMNGVAVVGTNGWWDWEFDTQQDSAQSQLWFESENYCNAVTSATVAQLAQNDAQYLVRTIEQLQTHIDARQIIVVTHTVPRVELIQHDIELSSSHNFNLSGSSLMQHVLAVDTGHKVRTWCFGHYHGSVDTVIDGVRYVNNCRGHGDTPHRQIAYYPKRIEIDI